MNIHQPGAAIASFREQTERQKKMPGVTLCSFVCKACGQSKRIGGRKELVKGCQRLGYVCAECHARREARKAKEAA